MVMEEPFATIIYHSMKAVTLHQRQGIILAMRFNATRQKRRR
jgi:hypothetical protein